MNRFGKTRDVTTRAVDQSVIVTLPDDLPDGTHVVSYRVVSQDGHPVAGSLMFSIGVVTGGAQPASSIVVPVLIWLFRIGVYLGLFAGVGPALGLSSRDAPRRARRRDCSVEARL